MNTTLFQNQSLITELRVHPTSYNEIDHAVLLLYDNCCVQGMETTSQHITVELNLNLVPGIVGESTFVIG